LPDIEDESGGSRELLRSRSSLESAAARLSLSASTRIQGSAKARAAMTLAPSRRAGNREANTAGEHSDSPAVSTRAMRLSVCDAYSTLHPNGRARRRNRLGSTRRSPFAAVAGISPSHSMTRIFRNRSARMQTACRIGPIVAGVPIGLILVDSNPTSSVDRRRPWH